MAGTLADMEGIATISACRDNSSNCSNNEQEIMDFESQPEAFIVPSVFAVILLVGIIGNSLLILSFVRHKTMTMAHNALVVNLASGDFVFLLVSLPFNSLWYTLPYWPFGLAICKLSHYAEDVATAVVITTLTVLSMERCLIVTGKRLWRESNKCPLLLASTIWLFALGISVPNLYSSQLEQKTLPNGYNVTICLLYPTSSDPNDTEGSSVYAKAHVASKFTVLFCMPLLIITVSHVIIAIHLLLKAFPTSSQKKNSLKFRREMSAAANITKDNKESVAANAAPEGTVAVDGNNRSRNSFVSQQNPQNNNITRDGLQTLETPQRHGQVGRRNTLDNSPTRRNSDFPSMSEFPTETTDIPNQSRSFDIPSAGDNGSENLTDVEYKIQESREVNDDLDEHTEPLMKDQIDLSKRVQSTVTRSSGSIKVTKETTPLKVNQPFKQKPRRESAAGKRRRLAVTVLCLIAAFAICWAPRHIFQLWFHFCPADYDHFWHAFKILGFCLSFSNSAVNPLVFYVLDVKYRELVHSVLCGLCSRYCKSKTETGDMPLLTIGDNDYNATIAVTDSKVSKMRNNGTQV